MKIAITTMLAFSLATAMCLAIPIPTSVFWTIEEGQFIVKLKVYNATETLHNLQAQTQDGKYAMVIATNGIKLVNVEMAVLRDSTTLYNKTYTDIETGSKLNVDLYFEPEQQPAETVNVEKPGSGGGGGGGGTYEPTIKDIPRLREEYDSQANSTAPYIDEEGNATVPTGQDFPMDETGEKADTTNPLIELPKITPKDNQIVKLGAILLLLLLIVMIIQRRAHRE